MFNKKRIVIFVGFLCCLFFMTTFAGAPAQNTIIATRSVEFVDGYNDRTISEQTIEVGTDAEVPSDPEHDGYIFAGWYLFDDQDVRVTDFTNVLNDLKVIAKYQGDANRNGIADENEPRYTVTFIDSIGGNVLATVEVLTGTSATAPTVPTHDGYTFTGWDRSYSNVTGNITVRTVYTTTNTTPTTDEPEENYYNVVFIDTLTNRVIDSVRIAEGLTASTPETPTHEGYLFVRWDGDFTNVNSDREIYTVYVRDENNNGVDDTTETRYTVTFDAKENGLIILENGTTRNTLTINNILTGTEFGNAISKLPEVLANEYYIVDGWNETIPTEDFLIEENMIFTAKYLEDKNNNGTADDDETLLVVTFYDTIENKALKTEEVLPGLSATAPTPKEYDKKLFTGWDKAFTNITADTTINTIYVDDVNNNGVDDSKEQDTKKTLTIEYVSIKPNTNPVEYNKLADSKEVELLPGETRVFFANDVRIDYYTLDMDQAFDGITVTMPNEDTTIRFIYTPGEDLNNNGIDDRNEENTKVTLSFEYVSWNKNTNTYNTLTPETPLESLRLLPGQTYEVSAPTITNYVANTTTIKGVMGNENNTIRIIYTPTGDDKNNDGIADVEQTRSTLTIKYISYNAETGKEYTLETQTLENVVENQEYTVEVKTFGGYKFDSTKTGNLTFNMPKFDYTFTVYYIVDGKDENKDGKNDQFEDPYTLKINYISVKEDGTFGEELGSETVGTNFVQGEAYDITELVNAKTETLKENYTLFGTPTLTGVIPTIEKGEKIVTITISYRPLIDENNNGILDEKEPDKYTLKVRYVSVYTDELGNEQIGKDFGTDTDSKAYVLGSKYDVTTLVNAKIETLKDKYEVVDRTSEKGIIIAPTDLTSTITIKFKPINGTDTNNNGINDLDEKHYTLSVKYVIVNSKGEIVNDNYKTNNAGSYVSGAIYTITPENITGYTLVNTTDTTGSMPANDTIVTLKYKVSDSTKDLNDNGILDEDETKYNLTVKYVSKGAKENYIINTVVYKFVENAKYTIEVPENIDGKYTLVGNKTITGTMPKSNTEIEVEYKVANPDKDINNNGKYDDDETPVELIVKLVRKEGTKTITLDTITNNYLPGQDYEVTLPDKIENKYELDSETTELTGTMPTTKTTIEVVYKAINDTNNDGIADEDQRRIKYVDYNGTEIYNSLITLGEKTPSVKDPTREYYIFTGWAPEVEETVTKDATYEATYKEDKNQDNIPDDTQKTYTVTFYGFNNEVLSTENVLVKMNATAPNAPSVDGYTFKGWDKVFTNIQSNLDVYAQYADETAPVINASSKVYGNQTIKGAIEATINDNGSGIKEVRYIKGNVTKEEAKTGKVITSSNSSYEITDLTDNGYYTIYAEDNAGNSTIKTVLVEGIIVKDGNFEDKYATGEFGKLDREFLFLGKYYKDINIKTKEGVKIVEARELISDKYADAKDFENSTLGTDLKNKISNDSKKLNHKIEGYFGDYVTIYVKYEYQEEIAPGKYETRYVTRTYKTYLSKYWGQETEE